MLFHYKVERDPQVLNLPAPHLATDEPRVLVAPRQVLHCSPKSRVPSESLVVILELHVRGDLG